MRSRRSASIPIEELFELSLEELKALPQQEWGKLSTEDRRRLEDHLLELEPPERRAEIVDAATAKLLLVGEFSEVLEKYLGMLRRDEYGDVWECLETLAEHWREAAELRRLEQMGDDFLSDEAVQLFAALEDSLVLSLSGDEERRALRLEAEEVGDRFVMAGSQGLFDGVFDSWEEMIHPELVVAELQTGRAVVPRRVEPPERPSANLLARKQPKRRRRHRELLPLVFDTMAELGPFYEKLKPDGRKLSVEELDEVHAMIESAAARDRMLDIQRYEFSRPDWELVCMCTVELRAFRRSLVLARSADPVRRAKAMPFGEVQTRAFMLNQRVNGVSREEAWERLQQAVAAQGR